MLFEIDVSYCQVVVFAAHLQEPFSQWTDRHVAQGFAWRPGSASFRTFHDGPLSVSVVIASDVLFSADATRVIRVPFEVPCEGRAEIASIASSQSIVVAPGTYQVTFEHGVTMNRQWCNLVFCRSDSPGLPAVIRADAELCPEIPLLVLAEPA